jgi:hypothetical protein
MREAARMAMTCAVCAGRARYRFQREDMSGLDLRCRRHAVFYGPVCWRAVRVAAVVGTILFFINQADVVVGGRLTPVVVLKIALTFLVPFAVSTYSQLQINRVQEPPAPTAP